MNKKQHKKSEPSNFLNRMKDLYLRLHCDYTPLEGAYPMSSLQTIQDTYVRARIDSATKERATDALLAMGLSVSDAIRLLLIRVADEQRMPFEVRVPNASSHEAIAELKAGKGKKFTCVENLEAELHANE